jgi:acetyl-CoA acetyltransferase
VSRSSARSWPLETPAYDIQQACGTGLEAAILVANKIALGQIDAGIAAGVDTTSDAPITLSDELRAILVRFNAAKTTKGRLKALSRIRPGHMVPEPPRNMEPRTGLSMGEHCALMAEEWRIGHTENKPIIPLDIPFDLRANGRPNWTVFEPRDGRGDRPAPRDALA